MTATSTSLVRNYTTTKEPAETIGEMQANLARHGAARIAIGYAETEPCEIGFTLDTPHGPRHFTMPVDVDAVQRLLEREYDAGRFARAKQARAKIAGRDQAARVAWRVMADWLDAQLTLVAAGMTSLTTVMLPYLHVNEHQTLGQAYAERETALELGPTS